MNHLFPRQAKFAARYAAHGVAERAAVEAGYSRRTARGSAARLLAYAGVRAEVARLAAATRNAAIADIVERKTFLTRVMRDAAESMPVRLRAAELLGRMEGDFLDNSPSLPIEVIVSRVPVAP